MALAALELLYRPSWPQNSASHECEDCRYMLSLLFLSLELSVRLFLEIKLVFHSEYKAYILIFFLNMTAILNLNVFETGSHPVT